jgi:hypothetical protein
MKKTLFSILLGFGLVFLLVNEPPQETYAKQIGMTKVEAKRMDTIKGLIDTSIHNVQNININDSVINDNQEIIDNQAAVIKEQIRTLDSLSSLKKVRNAN